MKLNVFEGARRIALLVAGLFTIGCVAYAILNEPYTTLQYAVRWPGIAPALVEKCSSDDANEYLTRQTPNGGNINVNLCFVAHKVDSSGEMLVPYGPAGSKMWMAKKYSAEVSNYTGSVAQSFQLDERGIKEAKERKRAALLDQWKEVMQFLFGGLAAGWALVAAIGWIARGFMNIPRGKDKRLSE